MNCVPSDRSTFWTIITTLICGIWLDSHNCMMFLKNKNNKKRIGVVETKSLEIIQEQMIPKRRLKTLLFSIIILS